MKNEHIVVTISGCDKIGIVAEITATLAKYSINIEDIKQTTLRDQFVMLLLGDISKSEFSFQQIKDALIEAGKRLEMEIWVQRKDIFDGMHTI